MENDSIPISLTKKELEERRQECQDRLFQISDEYGNKKINIDDEIDHLAEKLSTQVLIWLDHNLNYISEHAKCIVYLKTDDVTKGVINSIVKRHKELRKKFTKLQTPHKHKLRDMPFNATNIIHTRHTLLPLVAEVEYLKEEVLLITKKIYKI